MAGKCCGCSPDVQALQAGQRRVLRIVMVINALTFVMVLGASVYTGSASLLSGGLDNFGDALTYALSLAVVGASATAKARVAMFKAALILAAAIAVGARIAWHAADPAMPLLEGMSLAALANLAANAYCLRLLTPFRTGDVNLASAWECSRNDVIEGFAVLGAALAVWVFQSGWPDLIVASGLLVMFLRSAWRVFGAASAELGKRPSASG